MTDLYDRLKMEFNISLTKQQQNIIETTDVPVCAMASPGSGKTLVYVIRIANLILNHDVRPENILALTFSRASARDMEDRFLKLFGDIIDGHVHFSTIHSFALQIVTEYEKKIGVHFTVIESEEAPISKLKILKDIYFKINNENITEEKVEELTNAIGFVKNMMLEPSDVKEINKYQFEIDNFTTIYQEYEEYKRQNNYIDYDDMLVKALKILQAEPNILNYYRNKYTHIQLDEGQDTSKIQYEIIKLLAKPLNNIFLVGDDDQSIYQFRAAFPEELLNFSKTYSNAKVMFMEENFRSSKDIVDLSSKFIQNNRIRYAKKAFTNNPEYRPVAIVRLKDDNEQIQYLIRQLKSIDVLSETAILYRNNISAVRLVECLDREGIPFYIRDFKKSFFTHWVIQDIFAFLDLAHNDTDMEALKRIYNKGLYISNKMLDYISKGNNSVSVFDRLIDFPYFSHGFQKDNMIRLKWDFKTLAQKSPKQAINFIEEDLGYKKYLQNSSENTGASYENAKNIIANLKIIAESCNTVANFKDRLFHLEQVMEQARFNKSQNAVVLSTIHSSKGLEWDNVFLIDLINGQFPTQVSIDNYYKGDPRELESERRLFYVGMTRSRKVLELITINLKNNEKVEASMFVKEVDRIIRPNSIGNILAAINQKNQTNILKKRVSAHNVKPVESPQEKKQENPQQEQHPFKVNTYVEHKSYGKGKIIAIDGDDVTIEFGNGLLKRFRLNVSVEKKIITLVS
jgi:DNA helicase-2/ATP-dependent DNA helicase PcrA